jgi:ubiquinone/menaquinone biosynthesis C-methylase UbiE
MEHKHVCPWWMGYLLASPVRRLRQDPHRILSPHVREGMTVLEPGPGMGFFTLELARLVGTSGKEIAMDVQPKMLKVLARRAQKAGLQNRIVLRQCDKNCIGVDDFQGQADFVLAFALVHELPDVAGFFREMFSALKPDGRMLLSEPLGHVKMKQWRETVQLALATGFQKVQNLDIRGARSMLLTKLQNAK